ncbi:DUF3365 domain-containing protein [Eggerthellaceae bacterium zg-887]|uniref:ATP-binding protein n=1 Tax=Xiamenia xianingshaonis TaxID=2682776 RepID=UPI0014082BED|nr:DUF3365 domain-containing protein [Xiamenia xianingshaonis]NHM15307.1 DUF3365 domain-containing protein [Xiamenia xianingshaonis]
MASAASRTKIGLRTKLIGLLTAVLVVISAVFLAFTYQDQASRAENELLEKSRVLVTEMDAVWDFVSLNQDVINYTTDGEYDYKGLHCAIAGKSVAALFSEESDYSIRFTNLNPRNIYNAPDDYEARAIREFVGDRPVTEVYGLEQVEDEDVFRYVRAMYVGEDCLECHGEPAGVVDVTGYEREGWATGDVAGAVSVTVPAKSALDSMHVAVASNMVFFLTVIASMVAIIYFVLSRLVTRPLTAMCEAFSRIADAPQEGSKKVLEDLSSPADAAATGGLSLYCTRETSELIEQYGSMAQRLEDLYESLESQVNDRTEQLVLANAELERQRAYMEKINVRLSRDNQYKSDFLAIVSHELRTPLTSILAFADLLAERIDPADETAMSQLEEIHKNGAILQEMIDNVLETARIQAGSETLNLELVDFNDLVGMVESSLCPVASKKRVAFSTRVSADVPLVMGDWEKLRRILANLASNAVKFTPAGGSVRVEVERVQAGTPAEVADAGGGPVGGAAGSPAAVELAGTPAAAADAGGECVLVRVSDTGIGIAPDKQDLVFERFRQEDMTTVRRYGGSGLGLSLVKDLVEMMGGSVSVESEPGRGSVFTVVLPALKEKPHD